MTEEMLGILTAGLGAAEMVAYGLAALALLRHWGLTLAEAAAGAALLPAMLASFVLQIADLTGIPLLIPVMRLIALILAVVLIGRHRARIHGLPRVLKSFAREHRLATTVFLVTLGTLAAAAVVAGWQGRAFLPAAPPPMPVAATMPLSTQMKRLVDAVVLHPGFPGAVLLPWLAYLAICLATYALARRYAWPPTAITVTLLVAGMPRLVLLSVSSGVEIIPAAAAAVFILALYRTVERPDVRDFIFMALALAFSLTPGRMGLVFPILGLALSAALLHRRHGGRIWWDLVRTAPLAVGAAGLAVIVFCQGWHWNEQPLSEDFLSAAWSYNAHGLRGASANLLRYGLQMLDLTPPVESALAMVFNFDWNIFRLGIHDYLLGIAFDPDQLGPSFVLPASDNYALTWFGPFAGLLVLPALGWSLGRGPRRLKSLALALVAYGALVALIPAWAPGNVRYFTVFFACAGFTTAFLLPPWRMTRQRRLMLQLCAVALTVYAVGEVCWRLS